jgi:hypothetical protein
MDKRQKNFHLNGLQAPLSYKTSVFNAYALAEKSHKGKRLKEPVGPISNTTQRILALMGLIVMLVLFFPCSLIAEKGNREGGPPPALVEVATVIEQEVVTRVNLVGTAEPWLETVVASEEAGKVRNMISRFASRTPHNST